MDKILTDIVTYLKTILKNDTIQENTPLLSAGMLDSLGIVSLLTHIDDTYGIDLADDDFDVENFSTPYKISEMIFQHHPKGQ